MLDKPDSGLHIVRFHGPFGYIKPWTAVRDALTYSQSFLTPSIVEGIRQKLEVSSILRHRLQHRGIIIQQERTQSAGWKRDRKQMSRQLSILERGVLLEPRLFLAFPTAEEAANASKQHICLCRNEDVLLPDKILSMSQDRFDKLPGFELRFENVQDAFLVGFNRFDAASPMYGHLVIVEAGEEEPV